MKAVKVYVVESSFSNLKGIATEQFNIASSYVKRYAKIAANKGYEIIDYAENVGFTAVKGNEYQFVEIKPAQHIKL